MFRGLGALSVHRTFDDANVKRRWHYLVLNANFKIYKSKFKHNPKIKIRD